MIAELAAVLLPVFCLAGVGYAWRRADAPFDLAFVTRLIMNVSGPCLVFDGLSKLTIPIGEFLWMVWASIVMLVTMAVVSFALLRVLGLSVRSYLPSLAVGNTGNLGLPLCLFALGEAGLGLGIAVYVTNSVGQFSLVPLMQAREPILKTLVTTPTIYGALAGAVALATRAPVPEWLATTIELLADLTIPLMLLALGHTIGGLRARNLKLSFGLGAARLVLSFAIALGVSELLGLSGIARGALILQGVMPAAVFNYLFAARYQRAAEDVAGIVLASTLMTGVLLPAIVSYVLWISG